MQFIEFIEAFCRVADRAMIRQNLAGGFETNTNNDADFSTALYATEETGGNDRGDSVLLMADKSIQPGEYNLENKIQDYIDRVALTSMGEEYAYQYRKKLNRKEAALKKK